MSAPAAPMTVAHRGAPSFAPENTAASFSIAAAQGADAIECDLRLSGDGVLVCHHDERTGRVWSKDLKISETPVDKLKSLSLSAGFRVAFPKYRTVSIPTFAEGVAAMGNARIFAEIKDDGTDVARALCEEAQRLGIKERLSVLSYKTEPLKYLHDQGYDCILLLRCSSASELLRAHIPEGMAVSVNFDVLTASAVKKLHDRGVRVFCYTVEGRRGYGNMSLIGVDGVTCENLKFLKE